MRLTIEPKLARVGDVLVAVDGFPMKPQEISREPVVHWTGAVVLHLRKPRFQCTVFPEQVVTVERPARVRSSALSGLLGKVLKG